MKLLLQSTCDMYQDKKQRYIELMKDAVDMAEKQGATLLGGWHSVIGPADQITNLWGYGSAEIWLKVKQNLEKDTKWNKLSAEMQPCVRYENTKLLEPVPYSPDWKLGYQYLDNKGCIWLQSTIDVWPNRLAEFYKLMAPFMPQAKALGMCIVGGYITVVGNAYELTDYWHYHDADDFARYWIKPHLGLPDKELAALRGYVPDIRINEDHEVYKVLRPLPYSHLC